MSMITPTSSPAPHAVTAPSVRWRPGLLLAAGALAAASAVGAQGAAGLALPMLCLMLLTEAVPLLLLLGLGLPRARYAYPQIWQRLTQPAVALTVWTLALFLLHTPWAHQGWGHHGAHGWISQVAAVASGLLMWGTMLQPVNTPQEWLRHSRLNLLGATPMLLVASLWFLPGVTPAAPLPVVHASAHAHGGQLAGAALPIEAPLVGLLMLLTTMPMLALSALCRRRARG